MKAVLLITLGIAALYFLGVCVVGLLRFAAKAVTATRRISRRSRRRRAKAARSRAEPVIDRDEHPELDVRRHRRPRQAVRDDATIAGPVVQRAADLGIALSESEPHWSAYDRPTYLRRQAEA